METKISKTFIANAMTRCGLLAMVEPASNGTRFTIQGILELPEGKKFDMWTAEGFWVQCLHPHPLDLIKFPK